MITKQDLNIYRTVSLGGAILIPLFSLVYRQTNPGAYDPFVLRALMSCFAAAVFIFTYTERLRPYLIFIVYGLFYTAIVWFMLLLYKNQYNVNYFLGFILVIYVSMLGFKRPMHLISYVVTVITVYVATIFALNGHTEANLYIITILLLSMFVVSYFTLSAKWHFEAAISKANEQLSLKNKEITDSITYAYRIQRAMLPSTDLIYHVLQQSFVLYKPKDVVSGDFYAFAEKNGEVVLAAIDCTGHGVPGAFMSMIGHNLLSEIITDRGITKPSSILEELNKSVRKALKQNENQTKDGMDAVIVSLDLTNGRLQYAGANRPLWLINSLKLTVGNKIDINSVLHEVKATKAAIGGHTEIDQVFENHEMPIHNGDTIYLFSDGYADQFGGTQGKKMMTKRFKETLINIQQLGMRAQEHALNDAFNSWKGEHEQVDDVLVMGVRI